MIENRCLNDIWLEPLYEQNTSLAINTNGTLLYDSNNNPLNDSISGGRQIYKCDTFVGTGLLIHTSKQWSLIKGDFNIETETGIQNYYNSFVIPDSEIVNYKIEARIVNIKSFDGSYTALSSPYDSSQYSIFKVFLNSKEVTDYYTNGSIVGFNSGYNAFGNNLTVIYYRKNQTITTQTCKLYFKNAISSVPSWDSYNNGIRLSGTVTKHPTNSCQFVGSGTTFTTKLKEGYIINVYDTLYKVVNIINNTNIIVDSIIPTIPSSSVYLYTAYNLLSVDNDFSFTPSSNFYQKNIVGSKLGIRKYLSTNQTTQLTKWVDNDPLNYTLYSFPVMYDKILNYINKDSKFRLVAINRVTKEMTILTNARLSEKSTLSYGSDKNTESLNIEYEQKITIIDYNETFGDTSKTYGIGYFGGIKILRSNS